MLPAFDATKMDCVSKAKKMHFARTNSSWMITGMKPWNYDFLIAFRSHYEKYDSYMEAKQLGFILLSFDL